MVATDRRQLLAGLAGGAAVAVAGCSERMAATVDRDAPEQVSVDIKTVPADTDEVAVRIARHLADNLERAGVATSVQPTEEVTLLRDVLINGDYDCYVGRHPGMLGPDTLRELLDSQFVEEPGWQNPFSYTSATVDDLLAEQRSLGGDSRQEVVEELQRAVLVEQPFTVIAFPDEIRTSRAGAFAGDVSPITPHDIARLQPDDRDADEEDDEVATDDEDDVDDTDDDSGEVRLGLIDARATRNLNPVATEFRDTGLFTGLLYDSLAIANDDDIVPWLADDWEWAGDRTLSVRLREDLVWHDGEPITADDAVFTYRFLSDTTLDREGRPLPAPRYRGQTSLVADADAPSDDELLLEFNEGSREVLPQALVVPILPRHVWEERTEPVSFAGIDIDHVPEALVWENDDPVGSGPFQFVDAEYQDYLTFERFDDHFLRSGTVDDDEPISRLDGVPRYEELHFEAIPSGAAAIELLQAGQLDATVSPLEPDIVRSAARAEDVRVHVDPSDRFYHVGYNASRPPLDNHQFRRAIARLIDREHLVSDVFERFGTPSVTPFGGSSLEAPELRWSGECPELPFVGSNGDVSEESARQVFEEAGYRHEDGTLVRERS